MSAPKFDFSRLSPSERLQLVEELWDSLTDEEIDLTAEQRAEVERRRERLEREGPAGRPWREVLDDLGAHGG